MAQGNIVWILGAGFSKPLGGPLLKGLFSPSAVLQIRDRFPPQVFRAPQIETSLERILLDSAVWLYNHGRGFENGPVPGFEPSRGERLWDDAEEFLDVLDIAAAPTGEPEFPSDFDQHRMARQLEQLFHYANGSGDAQAKPWYQAEQEARGNVRAFLRGVNLSARQLMAAECSAFMLNADTKTERWEPFVKWGQRLDKTHTVVTFNYDCAAERAAGADKLQVVTSEATAAPSDKARLFKMHGSTDWIWTAANGVVPGGHWSCLKSNFPGAICIATPGPNKRKVVREWLKPIWDGARAAIREAEAIVFVGYRFPPSDSDAREEVLGAIEGNKSPWLLLHTVLGPKINDDDTSRLRGLLSARIGQRKRLKSIDLGSTGAVKTEKARRAGRASEFGLVSHPLYSQDFVSAPGELFYPHRRADW